MDSSIIGEDIEGENHRSRGGPSSLLVLLLIDALPGISTMTGGRDEVGRGVEEVGGE